MNRFTFAVVAMLALGVRSSLAADITGSGPADATALVQRILGPGITLVGQPVLTGVQNQQGTFTNGMASVGFDSGIVLSSGDVRTFAGQNTGGPETRGGGGSADQLDTVLETAGDADLTVLAGAPTNDANVLTFTFQFGDGTKGGDLFFNFVFASEEYINYIDSEFNDVFGFYVDGQNIALIGSDPISVNTVNDLRNANFYVNNVANTNNLPVAGRLLRFDGFTRVLTAVRRGLGPGTHTISLKIADAGDFALDAAVFIESASFSSQVLLSNPALLTFTHQTGAPPPAAQTATITSNNAPVSITASVLPQAQGVPPPAWVAVAVLPPGTTPTQIQVSINPAGLTPATYQATIRVSGAGVTQPLDIPVTLNVTTVPIATPSALTFVSTNRALPLSQTVTLSPAAGAVAEVLTPPGGNWLMIAFVPPGTNTGTQLTASINPAALSLLSSGTYSANIRIVSPSGPGTTITTVPVTLIVTFQESVPTFPPVQIPSSAAVCPTTSLTVGESYTGRLSATGGGGYIDWNVKGNFPPGLMLVGNTVVGAPNTAGTYTYVVEASSPPYTAQMTCSVTVVPGPLRITTGCPASAAPQGSYVAFPVIPSGGMGGSSYQYSATGLPAGLIATNGRIVGTPTADPGSYSVQIQVTSGGQTATLQCSLTISEPVERPDGQEPLRLTGACPTRTYTTGDTVTLTVTASGGESGYQFRISSGPAWLSLTASGTGATITGIAPSPGNFPVEVTVSDGRSSATFSCTIVVNAPPLTISASCPAQSLLGDNISIPLSATGGRGSLTWRIEGPSWLTLSSATGSSVTVSGSAPDIGEFPFTVTVTDEDGVSRQFNCTLRVTAAPVQITAAQACPARVERPAGISLDLTATGGVPPLRWQLQGPAWLSLSAPTGTSVRVTGVPTAQGDHSFTVTARDDRGTTPGAFTCSFNVPAVPVPTIQITGLTASVGAMQSGDLELRLSAPAPADLRATLSVRLDPTVDIPNFTFGNPWVQFGPLTPAGSMAPTIVEPYTITTTIPAGQQAASLGARVNLSNVAGTVRVQLTSLRAGEDNLLGMVTQPDATLNIPRQAPAVFQDSVQFTRSELVFQGSSNTLDVQSVTLTFNPAADADLDEGSSFTFASEIQSRVQQTFRTRFENAAAGRPTGPFMGSTFELRFPLSIEGDIEAVGSVTISITNAAGTTQSGPHPLR